MNPLVERLQLSLAEAQHVGEAVGLLLVHAAAIDRIDALHGSTLAIACQPISPPFCARRRCASATGRAAFPRRVCVRASPRVSEGIAMLAANRVMTLLAPPMQFGGNSVAPDAAVGIALFPHQAHNAGELLQRAKHALHSARGHRDRCGCTREPRYRKRNRPARIREPVARGDRAERTDALLSAAARHTHGTPDRRRSAPALERRCAGFVPPNIAVQAAESAGLIDHLTMWVITSAIQSCVEFQKIDPDFHISINISPSNLREVDLPFYVDRALRTWNVRAAASSLKLLKPP